MDCSTCHNKVTIGGPMWISSIFNKELITQIIDSIDDESASHTRESIKLHSNVLKDFFTIALNELDDYPYHYINDEIGKVLKKKVLSIVNIIELLNENGYLSSRTIFASNGFKTNASIMDIKNILY